ncbi:MAG TPA: A/G-specific adenine glycosylase [Usitatibacter sp.]|nr:A/G-specific adenine glycosylase [Usitatibacter sp.]
MARSFPSDSFAARVIAWQRSHGRHGLPWQESRDAYRIWLSEVMLQQTQVATVIPYFERFLARFPTVRELAAAPEDDVLALWSGLGYYARARNLHRAAKDVVARHGGVFPVDSASLHQLPGVGRSTAAAIAAFACGERGAILDGNVRRVVARHAGIGGDPSSAAVVAALWQAADARLPDACIEPYTQGMMDLGAGICTVRKPACLLCPVAADCVALNEDRIDELPGKRARRESPRRRVSMLVVLSQGEVLLEKRPPTGIWGGLWSLPEAPADTDPGIALASWGFHGAAFEPLAPFEHAFTHFTLEVTPWRVQPRNPPQLAAERRATWLPLSDLAGAALPSPIRKLLQGL